MDTSHADLQFLISILTSFSRGTNCDHISDHAARIFFRSLRVSLVVHDFLKKTKTTINQLSESSLNENSKMKTLSTKQPPSKGCTSDFRPADAEILMPDI